MRLLSELALLGLCSPGQGEGKFSRCLFLSKSRIWFGGSHLLSILCPPRWIFSSCFHCYELRTWFSSLPAWGMQVVSSYLCKQLNCQAEGPMTWPNRNMGCTPHAARVLLTVASFQGNRVLLPNVFGGDSESGEDSVFCTLWGNNSFVHDIIQHCQECLYSVPADTWQDSWIIERIFSLFFFFF